MRTGREGAFWTLVSNLKSFLNSDKGHYSNLEAYFRRRGAGTIKSFWDGIVGRFEESSSWDLHAVGAILDGKLGVEFFEEFQFWLILQGREAFERALEQPECAVNLLPPGGTSPEFNYYYLTKAPLNVYEHKTGRDLPSLEDLRPSRIRRGKPWSWRELQERHPSLWKRFFLQRELRPQIPLEEQSNFDLIDTAVSSVGAWIDIYSDPEYYLEQVRTLSKAQRCLMASVWLNLEVNNGGFDQFFSNSTGIVAMEALEGAQLFEADGVEAGLSKIMAAFPGGAPSRDRRKRNLQMETRWKGKSTEEEFKVPWKDLEKLPARIASYIRANPTEFFRSK